MFGAPSSRCQQRPNGQAMLGRFVFFHSGLAQNPRFVRYPMVLGSRAIGTSFVELYLKYLVPCEPPQFLKVDEIRH
jgi:hypothetical protein